MVSRTLRAFLTVFPAVFLASIAIAFSSYVVLGEDSVSRVKGASQWLAKDLAQQFTFQAGRALTLVTRLGERTVLSSQSGASLLSPDMRRDLENDPHVHALYLFEGPSERPIAKIEKDGLTLRPEQLARLKPTLEAALRSGRSFAGAKDLRVDGAGSTGVSILAVRLGDTPRVLVLTFDETLFSRPIGGPLGEQWLLMTEDRSVLVRSQDEGAGLLESEISALAQTQNPTGDRADWSKEFLSPSGRKYQIDAVQTGLFGVTAIVTAPMSESSKAIQTLLYLSLGISTTITLLWVLIATLLTRRQTGQAKESQAA